MEEVFKNRIITISGEPASGKGTTVRALKEKFQQEGYNVYVISVGDMFREVSVEEFKKEHPEIENPTIEQVNNDKEFTQKRAEIDRNIDSYIAKKGLEINSIHRPNDVYIIDSRLAFSNVPDSFAIRLTVDPNIAGRRVFGDDSRGTEDEYESIEEATESTRKRTRGEVERYKERYGVDLTDKNNYDLVIDTSYSTTEDILNVIYMCEEEKEKVAHFLKHGQAQRNYFRCKQ